ncbi:MAG TPA: DNA/RNA non-specific endonuclease, partial [Xanthobacteraceae bacterium]
ETVRNLDGSFKWIANEGIRVSRIVQTLKQALPDHPLLRPLYEATPASARISVSPGAGANVLPHPTASAPPKESTAMAESRIISVPFEARFQIQRDGRVIPLPAIASGESLSGIEALLEKSTKKKQKAAAFDAPFNPDYSTRKGFAADFLGNGAKRVGLPKLDAAHAAVAAPLLPPLKGNVLHYHNYSVVMHAERRFAIYSAANVSFAHRFEMSRPADVWRRDPRILAKYQIENFYYQSNQFDRGHLTRREDLEFGPKPGDALESAGDTCHWTNCTPQHAKFNQNKEIWQGIERHVLETSIVEGHFNAQVITGPVFDEGDPEYRKIRYPLRYWKVVAALNPDGVLFATAYVASQEEVIDQFGIEVVEVPFSPFKTFQTKIAEVERLAGLTFVCGAEDKDALRQHDPLEQPGKKPKRKRTRTMESTGRPDLPPNYYEIEDFDDITV